MQIPEISSENIKDILFLPLVFILIFIIGSTIFLVLNITHYYVFATWCFSAAAVVIGLVLLLSYRKVKKELS